MLYSVIREKCVLRLAAIGRAFITPSGDRTCIYTTVLMSTTAIFAMLKVTDNVGILRRQFLRVTIKTNISNTIT